LFFSIRLPNRNRATVKSCNQFEVAEREPFLIG
jgi:hypothetical protein